MSVADVYARGFHKQTRHYYAQWLPTQAVSLGTVGVLEGGHFFRPQTTLADLGIAFDPEADVVRDPSPSGFNFTSTRGASVSVKLAGEADTRFPSIPTASAGVGIEFSSEGAFVIQAAEAYEPRIRDTTRLERDILEAYERGQWKRNFAVIFSIVEAPYADIVISESKASSLALQAAADVAVGAVKLGNAEAVLSATRQSGSVLDMTGSRDVTPAFQLYGLKSRFLRSPGVGALSHGVTRSEDAGQTIDQLYVGRLGEPSESSASSTRSPL